MKGIPTSRASHIDVLHWYLTTISPTIISNNRLISTTTLNYTPLAIQFLTHQVVFEIIVGEIAVKSPYECSRAVRRAGAGDASGTACKTHHQRITTHSYSCT